MRRLEVTPRARRDIKEIWDYSVDQFGLDKADAYLRDIQRAAMAVTEDPRRGLDVLMRSSAPASFLSVQARPKVNLIVLWAALRQPPKR